MVLAFIIAATIIFALNLILNILVIGFNMSEGTVPYIAVVNVVIDLLMVTFGIIAAVSL